MSNLNIEKKIRVIDAIICVVIGSLYAYAAWASGHVDVLFAIRIILVFWSLVVLTRFARLLQYMTTFNVDLARYIDRDLDSIEIPFKHKFKEWKQYLKEPLRKAQPFYIVFLLFYLLHMFIKINDGIYFVTTGLLLFTFSTIVALSTAKKADAYIAAFYSNYKPDMSSRYRKIEISTYLKKGLIAAVAFDLCLILVFDVPIYRYVLYYLAFSLLYSFSAMLIHLYKSFSEAIHVVLGHKLDRIPLRMGHFY